MKITETKEYQDFLSVLKNVGNEELSTIIEDAAYEVILIASKKVWSVSYDECDLIEKGKDTK